MLNDAPSFVTHVLLTNGSVLTMSALDLEEIKRAAKGLDPQPKEKHLTRLNRIAQSLGFDGWTDLGREWPRIEEFMKEHRLTQFTDLVSSALFGGAFRLTRRQVADRLFHGKTLFDRLFTGAQSEKSSFFFDFELPPVFGPEKPTGEPPEPDRQIVEEALARGDSNFLRRVVRQYSPYLPCCFNLLGDNLVEPTDLNRWLLQMYRPGFQAPAKWHQEDEWIVLVFRCFRWLMDHVERGWVKVRPYNENLVFLQGVDGAYDVIVRGTRNEAPSKRAVIPLPRDYWPTALRRQEGFVRWYFNQDRWEDKDRHEAEGRHYELGGKSGIDYPGSDKILETLLRARGVYADKVEPSRNRLPGFVPVRMKSGELLYVASDCVSIGDFREFLHHSNWHRLRTGDDLGFFQEARLDLPAPASWLDAMAYCSWFEGLHQSPVRLLTRAEHIEITGSLIRSVLPGDNTLSLKWDPKYVRINDRLRGEDPPRSVRYRDELRWVESPEGLRFLVARDWREWLQDYWLRGVHPVHTDMDMDLELIGWHIGNQAGFRLCYLGAEQEARP